MSDQNLDTVLENQSLKFEFALRNLELSQVFFDTPDDLERENRQLRQLLDWVQKYDAYSSRQMMEAEGYRFPPIDPDISPDDDWYRFERWLEGRPVRLKLEYRLPPYYTPKSPETLNDEEILEEFQKLSTHLIELRVSVDFQEDVPPRLAYSHLLEALEEEFDTLESGFWHLDGCTGYCPGCFQRPWCETGSQSCWSEDEEAGEMRLIDSVKHYVSPSPISLELLRNFQAEADKRHEEFMKKYKDKPFPLDPLPFDLDDVDGDDEVPF